jgi:hypothetical protein
MVGDVISNYIAVQCYAHQLTRSLILWYLWINGYELSCRYIQKHYSNNDDGFVNPHIDSFLSFRLD